MSPSSEPRRENACGSSCTTSPPNASASARADCSAVSPAYSISTPTPRGRPSAFSISGGRSKSAGVGASDASCMSASRFPSRFRNGHAKAGFLARARRAERAGRRRRADPGRRSARSAARALSRRARARPHRPPGPLHRRRRGRAAGAPRPLPVRGRIGARVGKRAAAGGVLAEVPPRVPVYVVPQAAMSEVAGFAIHRGLLAVGRREPMASPAELLRNAGPVATVLGLVGLANHDNVGGVFRNAAAFGADAVLLDETSCDPLYRKAIRVSVGAALITPFARGGTAGDLVGALAEAGFEVVSLSPAGAVPLAAYRRAPRTALLLGAEGPGLPPALLARTRTVRIPMAAGFDSLNVATASGIALHQVTRTGAKRAIRPSRRRARRASPCAAL